MVKKQKIYFAASIRGGLALRERYLELIDFIKREGYEVLTEHLWLDATEKDLTDEEIFSRDVQWINEADVIIAECTIASLGVGWEIAYAQSKNKKIMVLYNQTMPGKLSAMLAGNKGVRVIYYAFLEDLQQQIKELL